MKTLNGIRGSTLTLVATILAGCNLGDEPPEGCFVVSGKVGGLTLDFDPAALTMRGYNDHVYGSQRPSLFYEYPDWEAFARERSTFGLQGWVGYRQDTQAPTFSEESGFDQQGRILYSVYKHIDVDTYEIIRRDFDTWDEKGRPLRAFRTVSKDYSFAPTGENLEVTCEMVAVEYEYDAAGAAIIRREWSGVDPRDGSSCGGEHTVRVIYGEYPFWKERIDNWDGIVSDLDATPPSSSYAVSPGKLSSVQWACPPQ